MIETKEMKDNNFEKVRIKEGLHEATLKEIKEINPGQHGNRLAFIFDVKGKELARIMYHTNGWGSTFGETLQALGVKPEDNKIIDAAFLQGLHGTPCRLMVEDYEDKDKEIVSSISKVKPVVTITEETI